jgi:hypothetical protein
MCNSCAINSNPCLDSSCRSSSKKEKKNWQSLLPNQYNDSHEVAPRFPTAQRLVQSPKAALHKDMQKHQHAAKSWSICCTRLLELAIASSGLWIIEHSEAPLYYKIHHSGEEFEQSNSCCSIWINHAKIEQSTSNTMWEYIWDSCSIS